jgi:predicted HicB family RNase H-like nuclease
MKYSELFESGATETQRQDYLAAGDSIAITLRVPKNLKDAATEAARLHGVSFSAFIRTCIINELTRRP